MKVHELHYANDSYASDLPFKNFCKIAKPAEKIRNYQKQGCLVMIKHCLGNSQINYLTRYRSKEFPFPYRIKTKVYAYNKREQILVIHSAKLKKISTLKNTPFPFTQRIKVHTRAFFCTSSLVHTRAFFFKFFFSALFLTIFFSSLMSADI